MIVIYLQLQIKVYYFIFATIIVNNLQNKEKYYKREFIF